MPILTIPKKFTKHGDLVLLPRDEYERILTAVKEKEQLDRDLDEAIEQVNKRKVHGPFSNVKSLMKSLEL